MEKACLRMWAQELCETIEEIADARDFLSLQNLCKECVQARDFIYCATLLNQNPALQYGSEITG
jgi:hypothetical protein